MVNIDDVALAVHFLGQSLPANLSGVVIVGSYKKEPLAGGRVGVHGDDRNAGCHRLVNIVFQQAGIGDRNQNSRGLALYRLLERLLLSFGIVGVRTGKFGTHFQLSGGLKQTSRAGLPVGNLHVGGNQEIFLILVMRASATRQKNQQCAENQSRNYF